MLWNKFLIGIALVCAVPACGDGSESGEYTAPGVGGALEGTTGGRSGGDDGVGGSSTGGDSAGGSSTGGDNPGGPFTGGNSAGGGNTGGGGAPGSGGQGGEDTGGGSAGGAASAGGAVSTFDGYPDWVLRCALARGDASCGGCVDSKCVFCTYASPEEREAHDSAHEGIDKCGPPNSLECSGCQFTVSGCPPCA